MGRDNSACPRSLSARPDRSRGACGHLREDGQSLLCRRLRPGQTRTAVGLKPMGPASLRPGAPVQECPTGWSAGPGGECALTEACGAGRPGRSTSSTRWGHPPPERELRKTAQAAETAAFLSGAPRARCGPGGGEGDHACHSPRRRREPSLVTLPPLGTGVALLERTGI